MGVQSGMPDVSCTPLFNRDIQGEAYELWLKGHMGTVSDTRNGVKRLIQTELNPHILSEEEHLSMSYIDDSNGLKIGYNFMCNGSCYRLVADISIENRFNDILEEDFYDVSRVPHLTEVKIYKGHEAIGYKEITDTSFLDIQSLIGKASIFFLDKYLWNNVDSKVA